MIKSKKIGQIKTKKGENMTKIQIVFILLIASAMWTFTLYYRIYKKQIKRYVLGIGGLLMLLMLLRIARILTQHQYNILWYTYLYFI